MNDSTVHATIACLILEGYLFYDVQKNMVIEYLDITHIIMLIKKICIKKLH